MSKDLAKVLGWGALIGGAAIGIGLVAKALADADRRKRVFAYVQHHLGVAAARLGLRPPALVPSEAVANAASDGVRVLYNPQWIENVMAWACTTESCRSSLVLGVMAHELAHHVNHDAVLPFPGPHAKELRADYIAGQVLAASAVPPDHFQTLIAERSVLGTRTHPDARQRIVAIERGFQDYAYKAA